MKSEIYLLKAKFLSEAQLKGLYSVYEDSYAASKYPISGKWNENHFSARAEAEFYLLAQNDLGDIIGFIFFSVLSEDQLEIWNLSVKPEFWGKGLSNQLVDFLQKSTGLDYKQIILEVHEKNQAAIELYMRNGWEITHRRKNYYHDKGDAVLMTYLKRK